MTKTKRKRLFSLRPAITCTYCKRTDNLTGVGVASHGKLAQTGQHRLDNARFVACPEHLGQATLDNEAEVIKLNHGA